MNPRPQAFSAHVGSEGFRMAYALLRPIQLGYGPSLASLNLFSPFKEFMEGFGRLDGRIRGDSTKIVLTNRRESCQSLASNESYLVLIFLKSPEKAASKTLFTYLSTSPFSGSRGTGMLRSFIFSCESLAASSILFK